MKQQKKKVYRAGVIPYFIENGLIQIYCMKPSDAEFGGSRFQIAKGKVEEGESNKDAAIREAQEELGLFTGNIDGDVVELGTFMGRTTIFIAKMKDKEMFGLPHHETGETKWMSVDEFMNEGRTLHRPVVQAALRLIKKREKLNE